MSYVTEHRRMKPVMDKARELDIATNLNPEAVFEAGSGGFQIWCTPNDHPEGWDGVSMIAGAFSKPCSYVASVPSAPEINPRCGAEKRRGKSRYVTP